jgi:hypothetical protein
MSSVLDAEVYQNRPLRNPRHELFARARALLMSPQLAALDAGYTDVTPSNAARLDRRKDIQARVARLSALDEELIRWKRAKLEARLNLVAYGNILQFGTIDADTGELIAIDWRKVAESDLAVTISEFSFDAKTGRLTKFERDSALNAIAQLRDMYGLRAPTKFSGDLSMPKSGPADWTREELIAFLNAAGDAARGVGK